MKRQKKKTNGGLIKMDNEEIKKESTNEAWKMLLESVNSSTEELYSARTREIKLLKQLLKKDKIITELIQQIAEKTDLNSNEKSSA